MKAKNIKSTITTPQAYREFYKKSLSNSAKYWSEIALSYSWKRNFDKVHLGSFEKIEEGISWFEGGKLNITENCLDRHCEERGEKVALLWEPNEKNAQGLRLTYKDLQQKVCQMANLFRRQGIKKGDRICFYMSMVPELLIGILASARIGAIHSVVFGGFSYKALRQRIEDCTPKLVITNDYARRGNGLIPLKSIVDQSLEGKTSVEQVLVLKHTGGDIDFKKGRDLWLHEHLHDLPKECIPEVMDSEDPLFILYTSGSTGKPKGQLHTTAGYMVWAGETFKNVFQMEEEDIYWCTADIGWITGHSYIVYGPLLNGATTIMFEGIPSYPNFSRFWDIVDKYKVTHFYTAPTAIRTLEAKGDHFVENNNLSSLKVLGTVGEPINEEAWDWYHSKIGKKRCPIVDTWWQTETGGIMISSLAGVTTSIPGYATLPMPGVEPVLINEKNEVINTLPAEGNLCIKKPWPGMSRGIWGDQERYYKTYFSTYPGYYFTGDGAKCDKNGLYRITGRVDDVMNISGHRIGTAELEEAINEHPEVVESAVVAFNHPIKGQAAYAYVIMKNQKNIKYQILKSEIDDIVAKVIGPIAKPDLIQVVPDLPKTRSGKIMRRILREIADFATKKDTNQEMNDLDFGDISTLLNPDVVDKIVGKAHLTK